MLARLEDVAHRYVTEMVVWLDNQGAPPAIILHNRQSFHHCGQGIPDDVAIYRCDKRAHSCVAENIVRLAARAR